MRSRIARRGPRMLALAGSLALLTLLAASPAAARPATAPSVDVQSGAWLAPDGRSIGVQVIASCPERWSVVDASVSVSQPQGLGRASFPLTCIGSLRVFHLAVPVSSGTFVLGTAQATATVVVSRGKTQRAADSETLTVDPAVAVDLADTARLEPGGGAVTIDVTVACPAGATGVASRVGVFQGQTSGFGSYTPACDGAPHTFSVRAATSNGVFTAGTAQTLTFADVTFAGRTFSGVDDNGALQIVP